jgi:hypothetical protein
LELKDVARVRPTWVGDSALQPRRVSLLHLTLALKL